MILFVDVIRERKFIYRKRKVCYYMSLFYYRETKLLRTKKHSMRNEIEFRVIFTTTFARVLSCTGSAKKGIYNKELGYMKTTWNRFVCLR